MGITGVRMFVKNEEPTTIEDVLNHFDHVKKLIGPEHLGVGSDIDLDGYDDMPPELNKQLRAGYKGSYGFREKIDIEGLDHPQADVRPDRRADPPEVQRRRDRRHPGRQLPARAVGGLERVTLGFLVDIAACGTVPVRKAGKH